MILNKTKYNSIILYVKKKIKKIKNTAPGLGQTKEPDSDVADMLELSDQ